MDIVNSGCKTNDQAVVDSDSDVMPRIFQKFLRQFHVDRVVEYLRRNVQENILIALCRTLMSIAIVVVRHNERWTGKGAYSRESPSQKHSRRSARFGCQRFL